MGVAKPEGRIGIARARYMGHTETVTNNCRVIFGRRRKHGFRIEPGKPLLVRPEERKGRQGGEHDKHNKAAQDHG